MTNEPIALGAIIVRNGGKEVLAKDFKMVISRNNHVFLDLFEGTLDHGEFKKTPLEMLQDVIRKATCIKPEQYLAVQTSVCISYYSKEKYQSKLDTSPSDKRLIWQLITVSDSTPIPEFSGLGWYNWDDFFKNATVYKIDAFKKAYAELILGNNPLEDINDLSMPENYDQKTLERLNFETEQDSL